MMNVTGEKGELPVIRLGQGPYLVTVQIVWCVYVYQTSYKRFFEHVQCIKIYLRRKGLLVSHEFHPIF